MFALHQGFVFRIRFRFSCLEFGFRFLSAVRSSKHRVPKPRLSFFVKVTQLGTYARAVRQVRRDRSRASAAEGAGLGWTPRLQRPGPVRAKKTPICQAGAAGGRTPRPRCQCCSRTSGRARACEINAHFRSAAWAVQVNVEIWGRGGHLTFGCVCLRWAFFSLAPESNGPLTRPAWGFPRFGATSGETLRCCVNQRPASSSPWLARSVSRARARCSGNSLHARALLRRSASRTRSIASRTHLAPKTCCARASAREVASRTHVEPRNCPTRELRF